MTIRLAIIGLGAVTRNIHLPALSCLKGKVELTAGCDADSTTRNMAGKNGHFKTIYVNPQEMIEKEKPDIVSICTPPALHYEQTLMALNSGSHVFCEKPLSENLSHIDEIISASKKSKRFVVVNCQFPYMKIHTASKKLIGSPKFGKLQYLHASQVFRVTKKTEAGWRGKMQRRLCFEFGVHVFDLIRYFFDDTPVKVFAHMPSPQSDGKSEAINIISVEFGDGRAASIVLDRLYKGPDRYLDMRLNGEFASIHTSIGGEVRFEVGMHTREKRPFMDFHFVKGGKALLQNGNRSTIIAKDGINPFASATAVHLGNFIDSIQNGVIPPCTAKDNRNTMALVFAAYDSAQSGNSVIINE